MRLNDRVALITGGTSGIGEATALLLAKEGAEVAITGRNRERGAAVVHRIKDIGPDAVFLHADVSVAGDCRRAVEETMEAFGRLDILFNNASGWGIVGGDHAVAYCASKGGVVLMTKAMAIDHGAQGIRINCVCPGDVETPMLPADAKMRGQKWDDYIAGCANRPLGRVGTAEEIAKAVLFLASDDSSFMTGAALVVDGGGTAD